MPPVDRHVFEGVIELGAELGAAVTANAICSSANGKDAAKIAVMTPKQEIEQRCDPHRSHLLDGLWSSYSDGQRMSDTKMISA